MIQYLKLYGHFLTAYLKTQLEYRFAFYSDLFINVFKYLVDFAIIWVLISKFNFIAGWSFYELLFLYNLNLMSFSISSFFFWDGMRQLELMVQYGTFDSMLIYPVSPLLHLLFRHIAHNNIGNFVVCIVLLIICSIHLHLTWTFLNVLWFIVVLGGAVLIQFSVKLVCGALNFFFIRSNAVVNMTVLSIRSFIDYPVKIYNGIIRILLTFIIPYAFVNYFPSLAMLNGKQGDWLFNPAFQYLTPLAGVLCFIIAYSVWRWGLANYKSTGS